MRSGQEYCCVFIVVLSAVAVSLTAADEPATDFGVSMPLAEVEDFLRTATVEDRDPIPIGVTKPERIVLKSGDTTLAASWKIVDDFSTVQRFERKRPEFGFKDSYKHEIAAYELDKLLGLRMVPPTIERKIGIHTGAVQLWLEGCMSEDKRKEQGIQPPDPEAWNRQMYKVRLFHQLIWDTDYNNVSNILLDKDFRIYIIDSSRAFRRHKKLQSENDLDRFSRSLLDGLRTLTREQLDEHLGEWISEKQIAALLARRDLILERAEKLVKKRGETAVLYP